MAAAYLLSRRYKITLYEKNDILGGHTRTRIITYHDKKIAVDTGFIVFNPVNYPELTALFKHLSVPVEKSNMSFGFTAHKGQFEWSATNLNTIFGQRRNLLNPEFYRMLGDVKRFFRLAPQHLQTTEKISLGTLLQRLDMGKSFQEKFILPMGAAIWSCPAHTMLEFPAETFIRFFKNHGLLSFDGQHQWYTVTGGSQNYVKKITAPYQKSIQLGKPVQKIRKEGKKVALYFARGSKKTYDHVVLACHADEALALLSDSTPKERKILGAFHYQHNMAYLHSDVSVMPKRKRCWASWVYRLEGSDDHSLSVTYWMNRLQNIDPSYPLFVTLNPAEPIASDSVFDTHCFTHPVFTRDAIEAQKSMPTIQGVRNIWFCGAYQRYGFHEDGLMSAIHVAQKMGVDIPWH